MRNVQLQEAQLSQRGRALFRVCLQSASTYLQRSFLLPVTAASDLLVHKIRLNYVLLSPIVPAVSDQLPRTPACLLPFVGRLGSGPRLVGRIESGIRATVLLPVPIKMAVFTFSY